MGLEVATEPRDVETERKRLLRWNLALPNIRRSQVKLANFKSAKMPEKTELGQLCQLGQHVFSRMQIERNRLLDEIGRVKDGEVG